MKEIIFDKSDLEFLNGRLNYLSVKLENLKSVYLVIERGLLIYEELETDRLHNVCKEGSWVKAHIDFIQSGVDLIKIKIKEINNENN